mmetsp:Transcript_10531/g.29209  ORF Transcript_10531/g.29209 Transcript_10531/m.29209 type:complete len:82 (+) Transcript_10531:78-323(+)
MQEKLFVSGPPEVLAHLTTDRGDLSASAETRDGEVSMRCYTSKVLFMTAQQGSTILRCRQTLNSSAQVAVFEVFSLRPFFC